MTLTGNLNGTDQTMPLLSGYSINRFSHDVVCMSETIILGNRKLSIESNCQIVFVHRVRTTNEFTLSQGHHT